MDFGTNAQPVQNTPGFAIPENANASPAATGGAREALKEKFRSVIEPLGLMECWVYGPYLAYFDAVSRGETPQNPNRLDVGVRFGPGRNIFSTELDLIRSAVSQQFDGIPVEVLALTGMDYDHCSADELAVYMTGFCVAGQARPMPSVKDAMKSIRTGAEFIITMLNSESEPGASIKYTLYNVGLFFKRLSYSCDVLQAVLDTIEKK